MPLTNSGVENSQQSLIQNQNMFGGMMDRKMQRDQFGEGQKRYNNAYGFLGNAWGSIKPQNQGFFSASRGNGANPYGPGGDSMRPHIDSGPIWDQNQIQQQVNASRGMNDATTANRMDALGGNLAARGFGGNSPLQQQLQAQMQGQNLQTNTANDRDTRWNAAEGNAKQTLAGQTANAGANNQWDANRNNFLSNMMQYQQGMDNTVASQRNAIVAAMAGIAR